MQLVSLQLKTKKSFQKNLDRLVKHIKKTDKNDMILAPELYLSGYSYDRLDKAAKFTKKAIKKLKNLSIDRSIAITMITKKYGNYYNTFFMFHKGKVVHTQSKNKLFVLNDERKYFTSGDSKDIKIFEIDGLKVAAIICFELRFIEFWQQLIGADIILVPSMWGIKRKENFETLTQALAVINQCYVITTNSANSDMAKSSGIINPFGIEYRDDSVSFLSQEFNPKEIKKMRRYMNIEKF